MIIRSRKYWSTQEGDQWRLPDLYDFTDEFPEDEPKFVLDVSPTPGNKQATGMKFRSERHTRQTFLREVVLPGKSRTMQHFKRWPRDFPTGHRVRLTRKTPRVKENFISAQILEADDDRKTSRVIGFWDQDDFFIDHGMCFVESASSTPRAQCGHPMWLLDRPFTRGDDYEEALEALIYYYNQGVKSGPWVIIDPAIKTSERVYYGRKGCAVPILLENVLEMDYLIEYIVKPYRTYMIMQQMAQSEAEKKARILLESIGVDLQMSEGDTANWVRAAISKKLVWLQGQDTNRHLCLFHVGCFINSLAISSWVPTFDPTSLFADVVTAVRKNGYFDQYAHSEDEVARVMADAQASEYVRPLPPPIDHDLIVMAQNMVANGIRPFAEQKVADLVEII